MQRINAKGSKRYNGETRESLPIKSNHRDIIIKKKADLELL